MGAQQGKGLAQGHTDLAPGFLPPSSRFHPRSPTGEGKGEGCGGSSRTLSTHSPTASAPRTTGFPGGLNSRSPCLFDTRWEGEEFRGTSVPPPLCSAPQDLGHRSSPSRPAALGALHAAGQLVDTGREIPQGSVSLACPRPTEQCFPRPLLHLRTWLHLSACSLSPRLPGTSTFEWDLVSLPAPLKMTRPFPRTSPAPGPRSHQETALPSRP